MRKIIILFLIISCHLYGEDSTSVKTFKRWSIGLSFSPDYSYRVIKPIESDGIYNATNKEVADSMNLTEKATISYSFGMPVSYKFNKLFGFKTGIYLSNKTVKSKNFVYENGFYSGADIFKTDHWTKSNFFFLEIPLAVELTLQSRNSKKLSYKMFAGVTICNNIEEHDYPSRRWWIGYAHQELESSYVELNVSKFNLLYIGYTAGLNAIYKLNEKLNLSLEPVFKFYGKEYRATAKTNIGYKFPQNFNRFSGVYEMPYSIGCNIGLNYMF